MVAAARSRKAARMAMTFAAFLLGCVCCGVCCCPCCGAWNARYAS